MPAASSRRRATSRSATASSLRRAPALAQGAPILCDAEMVAHGITRARLPARNDVVCTLRDPRVPALAERLGTTRSAAALDLWGEQLAGAVVAIGNAPTALFRLLEMLDAGAPRPAAILGIPVGFVGAAESKDALATGKHGVPYLIVRGRIGGSAMTAAAVNALATERAMSGAARLIGVGVGPGRSRADDAQGAARAARGRRGRPFRQGRQCRARARTIADEPSASRRRRAGAALSRDHRNPQGRARLLQRDRAPSTTAAPPRIAAHLDAGRAVAVLCEGDPLFYGSYMHLHVRLALALPDRGDRRRHRHVRLLVGGRRADRPGRRRLHRAAGHAAGGGAGTPPRRCRCRRDHEARPQPAQGAPRRWRAAGSSAAPSMSSAAP